VLFVHLFDLLLTHIQLRNHKSQHNHHVVIGLGRQVERSDLSLSPDREQIVPSAGYRYGDRSKTMAGF